MKRKKLLRKEAYRFKRFARKAYSAFNSLHRVVNIGVVTSCMLTFAHSTPTAAQNKNEVEHHGDTLTAELDEVMVTASRVELPLAQTPRLVTVISKEQVAQSPVQSLQDLLVYAANIDILQRGGHGAQADVSIRGGSFDQTAILLNGINLSNAQTGHYSFDFPLNLSDIERIEIVQGPSALIFGSGAFSGGINIITKKTAKEKLYARVEAGMHNLKSMELRGAIQTGTVSHTLSVGRNSSDGFAHNTDYDIHNILWQSRLNLKQESKLDFQLGYNDKSYGANSFYTAAFLEQYERTSAYMATLKGEFGSALKFIPIAYWYRHHDQFDLVKDTDYGRNHHRGDTYGANLILQYTSKYGVTSFSGEVRKDDMLSSNLGYEMAKPRRNYKVYDDRTNISSTLEHTVKINKLILSAGALMNYNTFVGNGVDFYPSASISYRPNYMFNIASSWSRASRVPTFTELYYNTATHAANENLLPEESESIDLGLKYRSYYFDAGITGFILWGDNMIDWIKATAEDKPTSTNLTKLNTKGIEANIKLNTGILCQALGQKSVLELGYTHMWQEYNSGEYISESANKLNYLRDKFTARFNHQIYGGFSANWLFRYQKRMGVYSLYENGVNLGEMGTYPAFSTLDVKLKYRHKDLELNVSINNLYNTKYADLGNIHQPGFWLMGGVSYTLR